MKLKLVRDNTNKEVTFGKLYIDDVFECYTLEDPYQKEKIPGNTRIPEGTYRIKYNLDGNMNVEYKKLFSFHKGMLEITNIKNFTGVYIHIGNSKEDTKGCILVGTSISKNKILYSTNAYKKLYEKVSKALDNKESVSIEIV